MSELAGARGMSPRDRSAADAPAPGGPAFASVHLTPHDWRAPDGDLGSALGKHPLGARRDRALFVRDRLRARLDRPSPLEADALVSEWERFLARWTWHWFATLTFKPDRATPYERRPRPTHPERGDKLFRVWISQLNRRVFGVRWYKRRQGVRWCRATEPHKSGRIHFHALLGARELARVSRFAWMERWEELGGGWARIFEPLSGPAVRAYCAKYVVKGGQLEVGGPLADELVEGEEGCFLSSRETSDRSPVSTDPLAAALLGEMAERADLS